MQIKNRQNLLFMGLIVVGLLIGIWHFRLAMTAIFVFRENESVLSWIAVICGPFTTLIAIILAVFVRRAGSFWLIGGGISSLIAMFVLERLKTENIFPFFYMISLPMIVLGASFLMIETKKNKTN